MPKRKVTWKMTVSGGKTSTSHNSDPVNHLYTSLVMLLVVSYFLDKLLINRCINPILNGLIHKVVELILRCFQNKTRRDVFKIKSKAYTFHVRLRAISKYTGFKCIFNNVMSIADKITSSDHGKTKSNGIILRQGQSE